MSAAVSFSLPTRSASGDLAQRDLAREVFAGLTRGGQKTLPASWLYDAVGSALFEVITLLPEYGLTRADAGLLKSKADEIVTAAAPDAVVELGSGTGTKTRHILEAAARADTGLPVRYSPIDISAAALEMCAKALSTVAGIEIEPIEASYFDGIREAVAHRRGHERLMLLFLGSTIGNLSPIEAARFLRQVRRLLEPGDTLLVGADLVKPEPKLLAAYDDPIGATAAFNLNLLARINRELGGEFRLKDFTHEARWNARRSRVEMYLRSHVAQRVPIAAFDLDIVFHAGETIWTESSYKFRAEDIPALGERAGWQTLSQWVDCDWGFAETLLSVPVPGHG